MKFFLKTTRQINKSNLHNNKKEIQKFPYLIQANGKMPKVNRSKRRWKTIMFRFKTSSGILILILKKRYEANRFKIMYRMPRKLWKLSPLKKKNLVCRSEATKTVKFLKTSKKLTLLNLVPFLNLLKERNPMLNSIKNQIKTKTLKAKRMDRMIIIINRRFRSKLVFRFLINPKKY